MRDVPASISETWLAGDFTGSRRPFFRVTVQRGNIRLYDQGYNLYASLPFGATLPPQELPNGHSLRWDRSVDADVASATLTLYNCAPVPLGTVLSKESYRPGYFTFNRGQTKNTFTERWGVEPNEWSGMLVPDNIVRTYEGYGFDPLSVPEKDPHLVQTGVWMIDEVDYGSDGQITVSMRDIGRILIDQIIFPPITPLSFYPLIFAKTDDEVGFKAGETFTKVLTAGGGFDPNNPPPQGWTGPVAPPAITSIETQSKRLLVHFTPPAAPPAGYAVENYRYYINNELQAPKLAPNATTASITGLTNGVTYLISMATVYREIKTGRREFGIRTATQFASPRDTTGRTARVTASYADTDRTGNTNVGETHPGMVAWTYDLTGAGTIDTTIDWTVIVYQGAGGPDAREQHVYTTTSLTSETAMDLQTDQDSLLGWNVIVYGTTHSAGRNLIGSGGQLFAASGGRFFSTPNAGVPSQEPGYKVVTPTSKPIQHGLSFQSTSKSKSSFIYTVVPGDWLIKIANRFNVEGGYRAIYDIPANRAVVGDNPDLIYPGQKLIIPGEEPESGHTGGMAYDPTASTYWLSPGCPSPSRASSMVWTQAKVGNKTVDQIRVALARGPLTCYVSVFARGKWTSAAGGGVIPYAAEKPTEDIGAKIAYVKKVNIPNTNEVKIDITPIPGVTAIRLTFTSLTEDRTGGDLAYRALVRNVEAWGHEAGSRTAVTGPLDDNTSDTVVSSYTVTNPPKVLPGAGQLVGTYSDYTDIVKLLCAWGGFFWPSDGEVGETATQRLTRLAQQVRFGATTFDQIRAMADKESQQYQTTPFEPLPVTGAALTRDKIVLTQKKQADIIQRIRQIFGQRNVEVATYYKGPGAKVILSDSTSLDYGFGEGPYGLPNQDPVLGEKPGRVWGDFEQTRTAGVGKSQIPLNVWDKKTLMDGISYIRDITNFLFFVDETGGVVWRSPNIYSVGNDFATLGADPRRESTVPVLDERTTLVKLGVKVQSRNVRERIFVSDTTGAYGDLAQGYNPNPIGLRRVLGWTDQHFDSQEQCVIMADFIAIRALFTYRTSTVGIQANPAFQINDQVRIVEETTAESYIHYIQGISSNNDLETGDWTYDLTTHWLGENPFDTWVFNPTELASETKNYLEALGKIGSSGAGAAVPAPAPSAPAEPPPAKTPEGMEDMAALIKATGSNTVYVTNGLHRRWVQSQAKLDRLFQLGIITSRTAKVVTADELNDFVLLGPAGPA